jgi:thiol-disulfide isomerase/thioredoxin
VVVDFWATYCPPCKKQAPELARLSKAFRDKGVEVVGLSLNEQKDQAEVLDFIKSVGMTYNVAYAGERVSAAFLTGTEDETGLPPIPQLFIFGKDGSLVEYLVGYNDSHGLPFLERVVSEQLSR